MPPCLWRQAPVHTRSWPLCSCIVSESSIMSLYHETWASPLLSFPAGTLWADPFLSIGVCSSAPTLNGNCCFSCCGSCCDGVFLMIFWKLFARTQFTLSQTIFLSIENSLSPNFIYICFIVLFYPLISTVGGSTELAALVFFLHGEKWTPSHDILHPSLVTPMVSREGNQAVSMFI